VSHLSYADCCVSPAGTIAHVVSKSLTAHGLFESPMAPSSIRCHRTPDTLRAEHTSPTVSADAVARSKNGAVSTCWATIRASLSAPERRVVAGEREERDEAEQYGEAGRQHVEQPRRQVAVGEVAALRPPPDQQHGRARERGDAYDDQTPGGDDAHRDYP